MADKYGVGAKHVTNEGCWVEVVEKLEGVERKVRFENGYEVIVRCNHIGGGRIKNPYHLSVYNVGYLGVGEYKCSKNGELTQEYRIWLMMLGRCYDSKTQERRPTYKGITVCKDWHNFQNFAKWYNDNLPKIDGVKFQLDKDLLQENIDNKSYSPETCVFLPYNVNSFLANKLFTNTSGYIGVGFFKASKRWVAHITLSDKGKLKHLGYFKTPELASKAYQSARAIESEKVKSYLRSLNYLPEEIIQLVK